MLANTVGMERLSLKVKKLNFTLSENTIFLELLLNEHNQFAVECCASANRIQYEN